MPHDIAVSIINYRTADLTIQCVQSVLADRGDLDVQVVVVDNCSGDDSVEQLTAWLNGQPAGLYRMIVWSPQGETGDYVAIIGRASALRWNSESLMAASMNFCSAPTTLASTRSS